MSIYSKQIISELSYDAIIEARSRYGKGENISEYLRGELNSDINTSEIIELVYDLQAGEYYESYKQNIVKANSYANESALILDQYMPRDGVLLDVGCGELTTIGLVLKQMNRRPSEVLAFDVSWSRIRKGIDILNDIMMPREELEFKCFVADMAKIPLPSKSVDIVTSNFALYSSRGRFKELLLELFRVTSKRLILFEPCYEAASNEGKNRMDKYLYIKDIEQQVTEVGGCLERRILMKNNANKLTPTACYVILPPMSVERERNSSAGVQYTIPGSDHELTMLDNFYVSTAVGLCFPVLKGIPIIREKSAILASAWLRQ